MCLVAVKADVRDSGRICGQDGGFVDVVAEGVYAG